MPSTPGTTGKLSREHLKWMRQEYNLTLPSIATTFFGFSIFRKRRCKFTSKAKNCTNSGWHHNENPEVDINCIPGESLLNRLPLQSRKGKAGMEPGEAGKECVGLHTSVRLALRKPNNGVGIDHISTTFSSSIHSHRKDNEQWSHADQEVQWFDKRLHAWDLDPSKLRWVFCQSILPGLLSTSCLSPGLTKIATWEEYSLR